MESRRNYDGEKLQQTLQRRKQISRVGMFLCCFLVLIIGTLVLKGEHYLLFSFLLLAGILAPMFVVFECRKPRARELVLLAVWISLSVLGNELCAHTIPLHAGTTLVILGGVAMGPEAGFLIGACTRLVCNFFDGQGPWTPWQMVAFGILGFLAGLAFNRVSPKKEWEKETLAQQLSLKKSTSFSLVAGPVVCVLCAWILAYIYYLFAGKEDSFLGWYLYVFGIAGLFVGVLIQHRRLSADPWTLTLFTFFTVFLLYGGVMNVAALLLAHIADPAGTALTMDTLKMLYLTGAPYDGIHGVTAAFCMLLFGETLLDKVARVQTKYGIRF